MRKATLYRKKGKLVECTACQWYCKIPENATGICGIRANVDGDLYLLVYGKPSSVAIDPIEKKPLFHFLPGTSILSIGTLGCNFGCLFCQNWQISQIPKHIKEEGFRKKKDFSEILESIKSYIEENSIELSPEKVVELALKYRTPSIAFTYNEPTIFAEYAHDVMQIAKKHRLRGVFVSSGYESKEALKYLNGLIDAYNIDLKAGTQEFYTRITGGIKLEGVLTTIRRLVKNKKWVEITTLIIPGYNDSEKELRFIARFIKELGDYVPWHVTAFYPMYKMNDVPPTDPELLMKAYEIGKKEGLFYVYTGNIYSPKTQSTYCPNCSTLLIYRENYYVTVHDLDLDTGKCKRCDAKIAGVWRN